MSTTNPVRVAVIGAGGMARHHIRGMLKQTDTTTITALCEPNPAAYQATTELFLEAGMDAPINVPDMEVLLSEHAAEIDIALIVTPHAQHFRQAQACLEAGMDVLLEKPMVMNGDEANQLIETRDRTGKLLVVAFNGSMSPHTRAAVNMLRSGKIGEVLSINATVWQNWKSLTMNTWRQQPEIAGGGFLFDTGAHMLNTVVDLAGEEFTEVGAWLDNRGCDVDINGVVMGRLKSGMMVTMHGCGDTSGGGSDVYIFGTEGVIRVGVWGGVLEARLPGDTEIKPVEVPPSLGTWQQFLAVRNGVIENPCPPEVGLRMARLWDAIKASAEQAGRLITLS